MVPRRVLSFAMSILGALWYLIYVIFGLSLVHAQKFPDFMEDGDFSDMSFLDGSKPYHDVHHYTPKHYRTPEPSFPKVVTQKPRWQTHGNKKISYDYDIVKKVGRDLPTEEEEEKFEDMMEQFQEDLVKTGKKEEFKAMIAAEASKAALMSWRNWLDKIMQERGISSGRQNPAIRGTFYYVGNPKEQTKPRHMVAAVGFEGYWSDPREEPRELTFKERQDMLRSGKTDGFITGREALTMAIDRVNSIKAGKYYPPPWQTTTKGPKAKEIKEQAPPPSPLKSLYSRSDELIPRGGAPPPLPPSLKSLRSDDQISSASGSDYKKPWLEKESWKDPESFGASRDEVEQITKELMAKSPELDRSFPLLEDEAEVSRKSPSPPEQTTPRTVSLPVTTSVATQPKRQAEREFPEYPDPDSETPIPKRNPSLYSRSNGPMYPEHLPPDYPMPGSGPDYSNMGPPNGYPMQPDNPDQYYQDMSAAQRNPNINYDQQYPDPMGGPQGNPNQFPPGTPGGPHGPPGGLQRGMPFPPMGMQPGPPEPSGGPQRGMPFPPMGMQPGPRGPPGGPQRGMEGNNQPLVPPAIAQMMEKQHFLQPGPSNYNYQQQRAPIQPAPGYTYPPQPPQSLRTGPEGNMEPDDFDWPKRARDIPDTVPRFMEMARKPPAYLGNILKTNMLTPPPAAAPVIQYGPPDKVEYNQQAIFATNISLTTTDKSKFPMPILKKTKKEDVLKSLPTKDDFGSPIRWVKYNSDETEDGLAKVTDVRTGINRQAKIDGVVYVPIIDHNLERIGLTTVKTTSKPEMPVEEQAAYKVLLKNVDMNKMGERDWLAIEVAMGVREEAATCSREGCQSRCLKLACETACNGDTCSSGCLGNACTAFCKGPGCKAMCVGEECNAICEGTACETRCRGKGCSSKCRSFSCSSAINGVFQKNPGGRYEDHYPD